MKGPSAASASVIGVDCVFGFLFDLVEADGGFQHEEDVEALLADFADDAGDLVGLADGLVDRFAEFLDKVFDLLIQCHLPVVWKQVLRERLASPECWNAHPTHWVFPARFSGNGSCG